MDFFSRNIAKFFHKISSRGKGKLVVAATKGTYRQFATQAVKGTGKHRTGHPCRLHSKHPIPQGTGGEIERFLINLQSKGHFKNAELPHRQQHYGYGGA